MSELPSVAAIRVPTVITTGLNKVISRIRQRIIRAEAAMSSGKYERSLRASGRLDVCEDILFELIELRSLLK